MSDIRKKFWKQSKELIEGCNDKELGILRNMVNKAIEGRLTVGQEKYLTGKKYKVIE